MTTTPRANVAIAPDIIRANVFHSFFTVISLILIAAHVSCFQSVVRSVNIRVSFRWFLSGDHFTCYDYPVGCHILGVTHVLLDSRKHAVC